MGIINVFASSHLFSNFTPYMKKVIIIFVALLATVSLWGGTPAQKLVDDYKERDGVRHYVAKGAMMTVARPLMKSYSIAPLAHKVEEMYVLRVDKADADIQEQFKKELDSVLATYQYAGKSDTTRGIVDAYVHVASPQVADELVVYNPKLMSLYCLIGEFTEEELHKIQKKVK